MITKIIRIENILYPAGREMSTMCVPVQIVMFAGIIFLQRWPISELVSISSDGDNALRLHPCDKRNNAGNCSHFCKPSPFDPNLARCSCPRGFHLNSDQKTCSKSLPCEADHFMCQASHKKCMPEKWRCDGQIDCPDGSDEDDCGECAENEFRCEIGLCISSKLVCDGVSHCPNGTDEYDCCRMERLMYGSAYFPCLDGQRCILRSFVCDGRKNCADASDEPSSCPYWMPNRERVDEGTNHFCANILIAILILVICAQFLFIRAKKNRRKAKNVTEEREILTVGPSAWNFSPHPTSGAVSSDDTMYSTARQPRRSRARHTKNAYVASNHTRCRSLGRQIKNPSNSASRRNPRRAPNVVKSPSPEFSRLPLNPPPSPSTTVLLDEFCCESYFLPERPAFRRSHSLETQSS